MAKMTIGTGVDTYIESLEKIQYNVGSVAGRAIYQGAKIIADQIRKNIEALPVAGEEAVEASVREDKRREPTQVEKDGLLEALGITTMRTGNGTYNVKIGMDGYNKDVTKKYPKGKPNAMVARSIESGTSFTVRHPFIASAVREKKAEAEQAMADEVDKQIEEILK